MLTFSKDFFLPISHVLEEHATQVALVTLTPEDTFETLVHTLFIHHIHQIYVIDRSDNTNNCPINTNTTKVAVITLTDILKCLFN